MSVSSRSGSTSSIAPPGFRILSKGARITHQGLFQTTRLRARLVPVGLLDELGSLLGSLIRCPAVPGQR
jgi:hypothetical protein